MYVPHISQPQSYCRYTLLLLMKLKQIIVLYCSMEVKLEVSEPANSTVWIILVFGLFERSRAITGMILSPMIEFSMRLGLARSPAWYKTPEFWSGKLGDLWNDRFGLEKTQREIAHDLIGENRWILPERGLEGRVHAWHYHFREP